MNITIKREKLIKETEFFINKSGLFERANLNVWWDTDLNEPVFTSDNTKYIDNCVFLYQINRMDKNPIKEMLISLRERGL